MKPLKVPQSTAKLEVDLAQLPNLPQGAKFENRSGQASVTASLTPEGNLEITANCDSLTFLIKELETEVYHLQKENKALVTNINKKESVALSGWQHFQIWCGRIALGLLILFIVYHIKKRK